MLLKTLFIYEFTDNEKVVLIKIINFLLNKRKPFTVMLYYENIENKKQNNLIQPHIAILLLDVNNQSVL